MTCCKCNRTGRCRNCSCVKGGRQCQSCTCLPLRLGNCANTVLTQPPPTAITGPLSVPSFPPPTRKPETPLARLPSLTSLPDSSPEPSMPPLLPSSSVPETPSCSTDSNSNTNTNLARVPEPPLDLECIPELPQFTPMADPTFVWGPHDSESFIHSLNVTYAEAVHWKPNLFKVPYENVGKSFVLELARLFKAFATGSAMESIALKAATAMPILLLQKPARHSKAKDHIACLERRLKIWSDGDLNELIREGRTIQQRIPTSSPTSNQERLARSFANLMFQGKTKAALRLLTDQAKGGILHLDDPIESNNEQREVRDILVDKHPPGQPAHPDSIICDDPPEVHPVLFESIDSALIRSVALRTSGAAGPSGLDALGWRRLCTSFKSASLELCQSLALVAQRLCTKFFGLQLVCHNFISVLEMLLQDGILQWLCDFG